ncbi:MAG: dihydroorotase [Acidimicrobiia bacterium]
MTAAFDLAIEGGTVVHASGRRREHLYIRGGRLAHLGAEEQSAREVVDAGGLYVLPGMVDTHVHLMDPGDPEREDFPTGTAAAAARGVTTIVEHTHGHPVREVADLEQKRRHLEGRSRVDYGLAAHAWPDRISEVPVLWEAGITFFKIFTCTTHGVPGFDTAQLRTAFEAIAGVGGSCLVHCEDETLTTEAERRLRATGRRDGGVVIEWRSREAESAAVAVVLGLAGDTGVRATIAHVSHPEVAHMVAGAQAQGADVAAEACPQYFLLREQEVLIQGGLRKFTPPARARSEADEEQMWDLLRSGVFGHVSSDHAPSTLVQKTEGSIWDVHFGVPGLDTTLPLLLDSALGGKISLEDLVRTYSTGPARRYGFYPRKGRLAEGSDADLVLVDPSGHWDIHHDEVISKAGWTPYAGRRVRGRIVAAYLRGRRIAEQGEPSDELNGRFLPGPGAGPRARPGSLDADAAG